MNITPLQENNRIGMVLFAASSILLVTMGIRQSMGLFVLPMVSDTHLSIVSISFALAVGQFVWGATQPVFGAIADQYGARSVIIAGGLMLAAGTALTPWVTTELGLVMTLGVMSATGAAAGSFSILIGVTSQWLPAHKRSLATGIVNAGGSMGQLVFAPLAQFFVGGAGWKIGMLAMSASALLTLPLTWLLTVKKKQGTAELAAMKSLSVPSPSPSPAPAPAPAPETTSTSTLASLSTSASASASATASASASTMERPMGLAEQLRLALRDPSYLCLHAGFFTCGFHIAFLVTHWPGDLAMCGLPGSVAANSLALVGLFNIGGSIAAGVLGQRYRMKSLLVWLYASRAFIVMCYLLMPKTALNVYLVAAALGFTWLATVPPTAGLVGKLFGMRYLSTLFGLTLLSHQIGGFLGAWLGGISIAQAGSYEWMWYADIALALAAALMNLPIKEQTIVVRRTAQAC